MAIGIAESEIPVQPLAQAVGIQQIGAKSAAIEVFL